MCQDGLKAKWTATLYDAQNKIQQGIKNIQIPFLTLHGTKDKVVDVASSYYLMENAQSKDKTLKVDNTKTNCVYIMPVNVKTINIMKTSVSYQLSTQKIH